MGSGRAVWASLPWAGAAPSHRGWLLSLRRLLLQRDAARLPLRRGPGGGAATAPRDDALHRRLALLLAPPQLQEPQWPRHPFLRVAGVHQIGACPFGSQRGLWGERERRGEPGGWDMPVLTQRGLGGSGVEVPFGGPRKRFAWEGRGWGQPGDVDHPACGCWVCICAVHDTQFGERGAMRKRMQEGCAFWVVPHLRLQRWQGNDPPEMENCCGRKF